MSMNPQTSPPAGPKQIAKQADLMALATKVCAANKDAYEWYDSLLQVAQVWDNCVDAGDTPDPQQADSVFTALVTRWPLNPFFNQYKAILVPVMVNSISAWRSSDGRPAQRPRAYDAATEVLCTIAWLLGGQSRVDQYLPAVRNVCLELQLANDAHL